MNIFQIRREVRFVLQEMMQQQHPAYYVNAGGNEFPYQEDEEIVGLPENIDTREEYLVNWDESSTNHDIYNFPIDEFKKGIQVERAKNTILNILDISKIVIDNLEENPQFYSNLGV